MTPIQYIMRSRDVSSALTSGCHWIQTTDAPSADVLTECHDAGCYLVITDDVECCKALPADGVVLTAKSIAELAAAEPEPTGIVLQRPLPITTAIAAARRTLGEDTPQMIGVVVATPADAVAAAKAGADFLQVAADASVELLQAVRERSFTTPIVALGVNDVAQIAPLLDAGVSGIACTIDDVPPILFPSFLTADEA